MSGLLEKLTDFILPQACCLGCDEPREITQGEVLCERCLKELESLKIGGQVCGLCLSPVKAGLPCEYCGEGGMTGIDRAFAPYVYRELAQKMVVQLKFGPVKSAAAPLAREMALCVTSLRFDALVPVPLHPSNRRERGMNQSQVLCEIMSEINGIPVLLAIEKTRRTKRQSSLKAGLRRDNVRDAFKCVMAVSGKNILLVDDVRTTGNTARECAKKMRENGAASVCLLTATVAAHGGHHG